MNCNGHLQWQPANSAKSPLHAKELSGILLQNDQPPAEPLPSASSAARGAIPPRHAVERGPRGEVDDLPWAGSGPVIRELRRGRGIRLKALAEATGLSIGYLSRLERNEPSCQNPGMTNLHRIAQALDIPATWLLPPRLEEKDDQNRSDATIAGKSSALHVTSPIEPVNIREQMAGREVLLIVTYQQPTTIPILLRSCQGNFSNDEIVTALQLLVQRGLIRAVPPRKHGKPVLYVTEYERNL